MKGATAIHIDFETRSAVDLKRASTHSYAIHPSTDVWCMAYAIGAGEIKIWKKGEPFPQDILDFVATKKPYYFIAHNAHFELVIWNYLCTAKYGWPRLPVERTYCTMAMAYAMSLPGSLENAANATGLECAKDLPGRRLMLQMAAPRRTNPDGTHIWWDDQERLDRLYAYCKNDVLVERELEKRLRPLIPKERELWVLDYKINDRGIHVDVNSITKALTTIDSEKKRLDDLIYRITGKIVKGTSDLANLKDFLALNGTPMDALAKADIRTALERDDLPMEVRAALQIRQEGAKSSTAKLNAMLDGASPDDRVRGTMQYHGAGPGRWAGRRIQPHNMPRGELGLTADDVEDVIRHIDQPDYLSALHGPSLTVISDCLRSMINAANGYDLMACDFSAIEARVLAWLAGQDNVLEVFRSGKDIYKVAASQIFNVPYDQITKLQRQVGKTAILALGYQGGVGAFQTMAAGYNVKMKPAFDALARRATAEQYSLSDRLFQQYERKTPASERISLEEFIASDLTKRLWREANPAICTYWWNLEGAAMAAVLDPGKTYEVKIPGSHAHRHVKYVKSGSFLWCILPNGRSICYPYPNIKEIVPPWAEDDRETKPALCYMGVNSKTRTWGKEIAYGGLLAENITQGVARDFLVEAIFAAEKAGYPVVFHVHDELVCEIPKDFGSVEELEQIITAPPIWGFDCPIAAEGWRGERYRK